MRVLLEPTEEMFAIRVNGNDLKARVWVGRTGAGTEVWAAVLSIVPEHSDETDRLKQELPDYMRPAREVYEIEKNSMSDFVPWLRGLADDGGKGVVNNVDARSLGRIADQLTRLRAALKEIEAAAIRAYTP